MGPLPKDHIAHRLQRSGLKHTKLITPHYLASPLWLRNLDGTAVDKPVNWLLFWIVDSKTYSLRRLGGTRGINEARNPVVIYLVCLWNCFVLDASV